jgi:hypothetical protein
MEDCYFYTTRRDKQTFVDCLCVECHQTKFPELGWFWQGSVQGYGPFLFKCSKCEKVIYEHDNEDQETKTTD